MPKFRQSLDEAFNCSPGRRVLKPSFTEADVVQMMRWLDHHGFSAGVYTYRECATTPRALTAVRPSISDDGLEWHVHCGGRRIPFTFYTSWEAQHFAEYLVLAHAIRVYRQAQGESGAAWEATTDKRRSPFEVDDTPEVDDLLD